MSVGKNMKSKFLFTYFLNLFVCLLVHEVAFAQVVVGAAKFSPETGAPPPTGAVRVGSSPLPGQPDANSEIGAIPPAFGVDVTQGSPAQKFRKTLYGTTNFMGKIIYLNGENISAVRDQELDNVHVRIDKAGNIFIDAPQYEVTTQDSYHPLLQQELPRFHKEQNYNQAPLPKATYSKNMRKTTEPIVDNTQKEDSFLSKETTDTQQSGVAIPPVNQEIKPSL